MSESISTQLSVISHYSLVSFVILYYDYLLTLSAEIERFWTLQNLTCASFFFFLNRYLSLLGHIPVFVETFLDHPNTLSITKTCHQLQLYHQYFSVVVQIVVGVLLIMRVYALYDRSRVILGILLLGAVAVIVNGCLSISSGEESPLPVSGCAHSMSNSQGIRFAAAWSGLLGIDIMIFLLTLYKTLRIGVSKDRTLLNIFLRDGSMYFAVMVVVNLSNILTFILAPEQLKGLSTTFTNIISSTMISRLMLNLRDPKLLARRSGPPSEFYNEAIHSCPLSTTGSFPTMVEVDSNARRSAKRTDHKDGNNFSTDIGLVAQTV